MLTRLRQDVVEVEKRLGNSHAAPLLEVNEKMVLATLRAQRRDSHAGPEGSVTVGRTRCTDGTPHRALLLERFAQAIAAARRHGTRLALLFPDRNNFKQINDTLGHAVSVRPSSPSAPALPLAKDMRMPDSLCN